MVKRQKYKYDQTMKKGLLSSFAEKGVFSKCDAVEQEPQNSIQHIYRNLQRHQHSFLCLKTQKVKARRLLPC